MKLIKLFSINKMNDIFVIDSQILFHYYKYVKYVCMKVG